MRWRTLSKSELFDYFLSVSAALFQDDISCHINISNLCSIQNFSATNRTLIGALKAEKNSFLFRNSPAVQAAHVGLFMLPADSVSVCILTPWLVWDDFSDLNSQNCPESIIFVCKKNYLHYLITFYVPKPLVQVSLPRKLVLLFAPVCDAAVHISQTNPKNLFLYGIAYQRKVHHRNTYFFLHCFWHLRQC